MTVFLPCFNGEESVYVGTDTDEVIAMARDLCYGIPEEEIEVSIVKIGSKMTIPKY
jgi:hypothetical protein